MAPVVHLGSATPEARPVPVLTRLSLAELTLLTDRLGNPPLPIDLEGRPDDEGADRLRERLADGAPSAGQRAHGLVHAAVDQARTDPAPLAARLAGIGLLDPAGTPVGDVVAAFGVLAAPEALLVLDLAVRPAAEPGEARLRSWFAVAGTTVVQLATASGLTFELAWYDVADLPDALSRAATVPDVEAAEGSDGSGVGSPVELPFELFTDGTEAVRRGRDDLLAELVRLAPGPVRVDGAEVDPVTAAAVVTSLEESSRGRLRVLVTVPSDVPSDVPFDGGGRPADRRTVGVVSWLRVGDGWRSLTPLRVAGVPTLRIAEVAPADLAAAVAPALAEVVR